MASEILLDTISKKDGNNIKLNNIVNFYNASSDPAQGVSAAGDVYYNTTDNKLKYNNGFLWVQFF